MFIHRAGGVDTTDTASYTKTITDALEGGGVLWVSVSSICTLPAPVAPTLTMTGATFTLARTQDLSAALGSRVSVFYSQDYDSGAGQSLAFAFGGVTQQSMVWTVEEQAGGLTSGSPVTQSNSAVVTGSSVTTSTTLSAGSGEMLVAAWSPATTSSIPGSGAELFDLGVSTANQRLTTYWDTAVSTAPQVTWSSAQAGTGIIAIEAAVSAPPPTAGFVHRAGFNYNIPDVLSYTVPITAALTGGGVLWVVVHNIDNTETIVGAVATLSMPGATFVDASGGFQQVSWDYGFCVFYSQDYNAGAGQTLTVNYNREMYRGMISVEEEIDGLASGDPILQSSFAVGDSATPATALSVPASRTFVVVANVSNNNSLVAPGSSTELIDGLSGGGTLATYWDSTFLAAPGATLAFSTEWGILAFSTAASPALVIVSSAQVEVPTPASAVPEARVTSAQLEAPDVVVPEGETTGVSPGGAQIAITLDCVMAGFHISLITPNYSSGSYSTMRRIDLDSPTRKRVEVRGIVKIPRNTIVDIVDYEIPVGCLQEYIFQTWNSSGTLIDELRLQPPQTLAENCGMTQILRDLMRPQDTIDVSFCLGTITEMDYAIRSGVFNVIGRRDPVVVNDSQEFARGTLSFMSRNRQELYDLRELLTTLANPLLFQLRHVYELGRDGVLYMMPLGVRERWLPDGRIPQHVFDVEFVQVSPPPTAVVLTKEGIPFNSAVGSDPDWPTGGLLQRYGTFQVLSSSGKDFSEVYFDPVP